MEEQKEKSIGALWEKSGPRGTYMTGTLELTEGEKIQVVVFKNDKGDNPKRPDWSILKSKPKADATTASAPAESPKAQPPAENSPF